MFSKGTYRTLASVAPLASLLREESDASLSALESAKILACLRSSCARISTAARYSSCAGGSTGVADIESGATSECVALDGHEPEGKPRTQSAVPSAPEANSTQSPSALLAKRMSPTAASLAFATSAAVHLLLGSIAAAPLRLGQSRCQWAPPQWRHLP
eukprot:3562981-Pleurochrysis_carterae.AAC.1